MRKHFIIFISLIALFWVNWLLIGIAWNNFYDVFHRIFQCTYFLIMISIIIAGILLIKQPLKKLKGSGGVYETKSFLGVVLGILIVLFVVFINFQKSSIVNHTSFDVSGFGPISSKREIDDNYYFYMKNIEENIRFKTDKQTYEKIIVDENVIYTYEYKTDFFNRNQGIMYSFDVENYIDNRNKIID